MEQTNPSQSDSTSENDTRIRRARRWRIYGWCVIGLMAATIVLNLLDLIDPEVNRFVLPLIIMAYVVYVIFRKR